MLAPGHQPAAWIAYGGEPGGRRWSPLAQIDRDNVVQLAPAWSVHTRDLTHPAGDQGPRTGCAKCHAGDTRFEATPLVVDDVLYVSTPLGRRCLSTRRVRAVDSAVARPVAEKLE